MKESAQAALSWVRAHTDALGADVPDDFFSQNDIHVHVPAGAIPKDGPSAGITMATALASLVSGRLVRDDTAMTGELTLTGQVLPIGGLKEKALAAQDLGIERVIAPKLNEQDIDEIPEHLRAEIEFIFVDRIEKVFEAALLPAGVSSVNGAGPAGVKAGAKAAAKAAKSGKAAGQGQGRPQRRQPAQAQGREGRRDCAQAQGAALAGLRPEKRRRTPRLEAEDAPRSITGARCYGQLGARMSAESVVRMSSPPPQLSLSWRPPSSVLMTSSPLPAITESLPRLPMIVSSLGPPIILSLPEPPIRTF